MSNGHTDDETQRIVRDFSDPARLAAIGVSEEWIRSCAELVAEFQSVQQQFEDLEAQLNRAAGESGQDTLLL